MPAGKPSAQSVAQEPPRGAAADSSEALRTRPATRATPHPSMARRAVALLAVAAAARALCSPRRSAASAPRAVATARARAPHARSRGTVALRADRFGFFGRNATAAAEAAEEAWKLPGFAAPETPDWWKPRTPPNATTASTTTSGASAATTSAAALTKTWRMSWPGVTPRAPWWLRTFRHSARHPASARLALARSSSHQ